MKSLVCCILFAVIFYASAIPPLCPNGEWCFPQCNEDEYLYQSNCDYKKPEPTCANPNPKVDMRGKLCDYVKCYCKAPKVRQFSNGTGDCVTLDQCPKKCRGNVDI